MSDLDDSLEQADLPLLQQIETWKASHQIMAENAATNWKNWNESAARIAHLEEVLRRILTHLPAPVDIAPNVITGPSDDSCYDDVVAARAALSSPESTAEWMRERDEKVRREVLEQAAQMIDRGGAIEPRDKDMMNFCAASIREMAQGLARQEGGD